MIKKLSSTFGLIKLSEESGELQQAVSKQLIKNSKNTKQKLEEEIADVLAAAKIVIDRLKLDEDKINKRVLEKLDKYDTYKLIIDVETGIVIS